MFLGRVRGNLLVGIILVNFLFMSRVIFDIETIGVDFESLEEKSKEYLLKYAETEEKAEEVKQSLAFYPVTGEVVAIGLLNPDSGKAVVYFRHGEGGEEKSKKQKNKKSSDTNDADDADETNVKYIEVRDEKELLEKFWEDIKHYNQFITFNGRGFDCPFLILRSAILGVSASRDLMPYRYNDKEHLDLLEKLTFYGAVRKFSLDFFCKAFGIKSPKEGGITGLEVPEFFRQGKAREIAEYCYGDLVATAKLWEAWDKTVGGL